MTSVATLCHAAVLLGCLQGGGVIKGADPVAERVAEVLAVAVDDDATRRRAAVERLVDLGSAAVPALGEALGRGNHNAVRTAIVALGEIGDSQAVPLVTRRLTESRRPGQESDLAACAAWSLGGFAEGAPEVLARLVENENEGEIVRVAAALALARRGDRSPERIVGLLAGCVKRGDADAEILGPLALALARCDAVAGPTRLRGLLKDQKDPAARAGILLGLAWTRRFVPPSAVANDLALRDPVLSRCAILGSGGTPVAEDGAHPELREARVAALGLGAGDRSALALAAVETEISLRPVWFGAAAARGWSEILAKPPWREREAGESGRFAAAALLAWKGGMVDPARGEFLAQARAAWQSRPDPAAALALGALQDRESERALGPEGRAAADWTPAARIAWKWLRGELDRRRFESALVAQAVEARVGPECWLSEAAGRYAAAILGSGSRFFLDQSRLPFPPKLLLPPQGGRRRREVPADHPMYADLWYQLLGSPFDASLVSARAEGD